MANKNVTLQYNGDNLYPQTKVENITDLSSLDAADLNSGSATSGQVLTADGSGGASWATASGGMSNPMTTAGDVIVGGVSGTPTRLATGTSGQVLTADGSGNVSWQTPSSSGMSNPMTTQGDIIIGGSSGTPTRLAKGSNDYLLGVNGSGNVAYTNSLPYLTTAPSADNTSGIKIVVLSSEPATKYSGYLYIITGSNN